MMSKLEKLREAYQDVKNKNLAIRKAARLHGVPESTLRLRLKDPKGMDVKMGAPTLLTKSQEDELANHAIRMAHLGYGFTRWQVLDMAKNVCDVLGLNTTPTQNWFYSFLKRYPDIKMVKPKKREKARDDAVSKEVVAEYFVQLEVLLHKYDLVNRPAHIWNVDESGISLEHSPPKILAKSGTHPHIVTASRSANTTVISAVSALGETIPPYIIFKGDRLTREITSGGMEGTAYKTSETGWSNSVLFLDFFKNHFLRHSTVRPCVLLYDGHSTHITSDVIECAKTEGVHLFILPPHTSHCLQPLDISVFSPFKQSLNSEFHKFHHANPYTIVTREILPKMISTAYRSAMTVTTIMSGFRKSGIFPLDPSVVNFDVPTVSSSSSNQSTTITRKDRKDNRTVKILFQDKVKEFEATKEKTTENPIKPKRKRFVPPHGAAITEDEFLKQKEQENMTPKPAKIPQKKGKVKIFTPPFQKQAETQSAPPPKKKVKSSNEGSTSEVNKNVQGTGKQARKMNPKTGLSKKGKTLMKKGTKHGTTNSENCMVCGRWEPQNLNLQLSIKFVDWFQCIGCKGWVHQKFCTSFIPSSDDDEYICSKCKRED